MVNRNNKNKDLAGTNLHISKRVKGVTYYYYRHPVTKKRHPMGTNRAEAIKAAKHLNGLLSNEAPLIQNVVDPKKKTLGQVIDDYKIERVPNRPWKGSTRKNNLYRIEKIKTELGSKLLEAVDRLAIANWLKETTASNDVYNKFLELFVDIYDYAVSIKQCDYNEAKAVIKKSLSKKIEANKKKRQRLTVDQFWAIHEAAPTWLQAAMEISLVTLQSRNEVANLKYSDERDGWLYIIREKVSGDSDYGFIRIKITPQIKDLIKQTRDKIHCPYVIHYNPKSARRTHLEAKPHWAAVLPGYITKQFAKVRDSLDIFEGWESGTKPTFHEIRSLGSRIYKKQNYPKEYIQSLLTHSDEKTTEIYLQGGELTDDHYFKVEAGMDLKNLPNI